MKILFIAPKYSGGIGGHAKRVADKLQENGFDIELMHAPHVPIKKLKNPTFAVSSVLKTISGRKTYDIVHAFNLPSAFAMKYTKAKKKVLSIHGVYSEQIDALHSKTTSTKIKNKEANILKWADKLLTNSKNVKRAYKEKLDLDFDYIYGPIDIEKLKKVPENITKNEKQVVYIGRDSYEKGIDILKRIENKVNGKIIYCTDLKWEDAMENLKASSILVIPSRMESIPQVIKEAFYLKVPIIATNVGGIPELITDNENGILVPPNSPKLLQNAINKLLLDDKTTKRLSDAGYEFVMNNLTWEILLSKYVKFYENLVNS